MKQASPKQTVNLLRGVICAPLVSPMVGAPLVGFEALWNNFSAIHVAGMFPMLLIASLISIIVSYFAMGLIGFPLAWFLGRMGLLSGVSLGLLLVPVGAVLLPAIGTFFFVVVPMAAQMLGGALAALLTVVVFCRANRIGFRGNVYSIP